MADIKAVKPEDLNITDLQGLYDTIDTLQKTLITRYEQLADELAENGNNKGSETFTFLAEAVRREQDQVQALAAKANMAPRIDAEKTVDVKKMAFPLSLARESLDEIGGAIVMTPLAIISLAVNAEEEIFALFAELPSLAESDDLRVPTEEIAKLKLDHLAALRLERRRAYRMARREDDSEAPVVKNLDDLNHLIARKYARLCWDDAGAADLLYGLGDLDNANFLKSLADEDRELAGPPEEEWPATDEAAGDDSRAVLRNGLIRSEKLFQYFADIAEKSDDETVVQKAQEIAERQIARLVRFKSHMTR